MANEEVMPPFNPEQAIETVREETWKPYSDNWVYPVAAVVTRQLKNHVAPIYPGSFQSSYPANLYDPKASHRTPPHIGSHIYKSDPLFPQVLHAYVPIDVKKYNIADDLNRKNPTLLMEELKRHLELEILNFKRKFVEFNDADFNIFFVMPDQVIEGW